MASARAIGEQRETHEQEEMERCPTSRWRPPRTILARLIYIQQGGCCDPPSGIPPRKRLPPEPRSGSPRRSGLHLVADEAEGRFVRRCVKHMLQPRNKGHIQQHRLSR